MANELHGNPGVRGLASSPQDRPPAMGWVWGAIGLALLAWLVALFIIGDDQAEGMTVATEGTISSDSETAADATATAADPVAAEGTADE